MTEDMSLAIRQADGFHKNIALMFEDLCALVQEKGLSMGVMVLQSDGMYQVWNSKDSEHRHLIIFECNGKTRFIYVLAKAHDGLLRGKGTKYRAVCAKLGVDPVAPLLVCCGTFEPRDTVRFAGDANLRRSWAAQTVLLDVPENINLVDPNLYSMNSIISWESAPGTDSWYCEKATIKIRRLTEIHDSARYRERRRRFTEHVGADR